MCGNGGGNGLVRCITSVQRVNIVSGGEFGENKGPVPPSWLSLNRAEMLFFNPAKVRVFIVLITVRVS